MGGLFSSKKKTESKQPNRVTEQDKAVLVRILFCCPVKNLSISYIIILILIQPITQTVLLDWNELIVLWETWEEFTQLCIL